MNTVGAGFGEGAVGDAPGPWPPVIGTTGMGYWPRSDFWPVWPEVGAAAAARKDGLDWALVVGDPVGVWVGAAGAGMEGAAGLLLRDETSDAPPMSVDRPTPTAVRVAGSIA